MEVLTQVIAENPKAVADFKNGKEKALGALVGQTMKAMKGKADPGLASQRDVKLVLDRSGCHVLQFLSNIMEYKIR